MSGNTSRRYPRELKQRAERMVVEICGNHESKGAAMGQVAASLGIGTPEAGRPERRYRWTGPSA